MLQFFNQRMVNVLTVYRIQLISLLILLSKGLLLILITLIFSRFFYLILVLNIAVYISYMSCHPITIFKGSCKCHLGLSDHWNTLFVLITCHYCLFVLFVFPSK